MNEGTASVAQQPQPVKMSGGLFLTGTVIAVRTEDKEWEKVKYTQTTISISDGEQVFLMLHRHDDKGFTPPKLMLIVVWVYFTFSHSLSSVRTAMTVPVKNNPPLIFTGCGCCATDAVPSFKC